MCAGCFLACLTSFLQNYRIMMVSNGGACLSYSIYLYLTDAYVGALVLFIAALSCFVQLLIPDRQNKTIWYIRNGIALAVIFISLPMMYTQMSDLLPCLAYTVSRITQAQGTPTMVVTGTLLSGICWVAYGLFEALYLFTAMEFLICGCALYNLCKHHNEKRRLRVQQGL